MTDEQASKIVRAAWILGISMVVAGALSGGGPYRVAVAGTYDSWRSIKTNTWTGRTWYSYAQLGWQEFGHRKPTPSEPVGMSPPYKPPGG